jgi:hypothetical protein
MPDPVDLFDHATAPAADRVASPRAIRLRRISRPASSPGPGAMGPRDDRRGPGDRACMPAPRPARPLPAPGRHQRRARRRRTGRGHRLAPDPRALRPASCHRADPGSRTEPGRRRRRDRRSPRRHLRWSTASISTATTRSTPPGPTCCAAWTGPTRPLAPTRRRRPSHRPPPNATSSPARPDVDDDVSSATSSPGRARGAEARPAGVARRRRGGARAARRSWSARSRGR